MLQVYACKHELVQGSLNWQETLNMADSCYECKTVLHHNTFHITQFISTETSLYCTEKEVLIEYMFIMNF